MRPSHLPIRTAVIAPLLALVAGCGTGSSGSPQGDCPPRTPAVFVIPAGEPTSFETTGDCHAGECHEEAIAPSCGGPTKASKCAVYVDGPGQCFVGLTYADGSVHGGPVTPSCPVEGSTCGGCDAFEHCTAYVQGGCDPMPPPAGIGPYDGCEAACGREIAAACPMSPKQSDCDARCALWKDAPACADWQTALDCGGAAAFRCDAAGEPVAPAGCGDAFATAGACPACQPH